VPEAALFEAGEHGFEQQILRVASNEPCAKLREHREIKASIFSLQAKRVLPIQTSAHGMGSLPIGSPFSKLQNGDQSQSPWSQCWLTIFGEQSSEHFVLKERSKLIAHLHKGTAFWENGLGKAYGFLGDWAKRFRFE
jgi:hypothetical protein